ncbi:MAG: MOSC domain-containing protein [Kofleriaceae bacterium]
MFEGALLAIYTVPSAGEPAVEHSTIAAKAGCGLEGDRFATDVAKHTRGYTKIRAVSLIEEETVAALARDHAIAVTPIELRRNLLTRGVPLNHLVGRRFRIGEVLLEGTELCEPCQYLADRLGRPVLKPLLHRGGLRAAILGSGTLAVGATIRPA